MKSTKIWIVLLLVVVAGAGAALLWQHQAPETEGGVAVVSVDGEEIMRLDLAADGVYEYPVETEAGTNLITVRDGTVAVTDADCPDQVCVQTGAISNSTKPIVCLPHKLVVEVVEDTNTDIDATAQ